MSDDSSKMCFGANADDDDLVEVEAAAGDEEDDIDVND